MKKITMCLCCIFLTSIAFSQNSDKTFRLKYLFGAPEARSIKREQIKQCKAKYQQSDETPFKPARIFTRIKPKIKIK